VSRPRALVVTPRMPWPLDDGGRVALWQAVWSTAIHFDTTLVSLVPPHELEARIPTPPRPVELKIVRVPHAPPPFLEAAWRGAFGRWPYTIARYRSARLEATLRRRVQEERPVLVLVNNLAMASYAETSGEAAFVLRTHNLEWRWLDRYAGSLRDPLSRAYARIQARRMRATEADLCTRCDLVLSIQEDETRELRELAPGARIETVPVGVDFARYAAPAPEQPPVVLLTGSFGWAPNPEGARKFLAEGWPRVREHVPAARLRLVGKDLSADLATAARAAGAEAVGYVESMAPEFARSTAMVVPLWIGGGARVKIVEAFAARLPVVSTPIGCEGLGLTPGRHLIEAATAPELGDRLADLLQTPALAAALAEAGHAFAREHFSLDVVAERTHALIVEAVERRARSPRPGRVAAGAARPTA